MKTTYKTVVTGVLLGFLAAGPQWGFAGTTGANFTDILPPGGAANTTVISNGTGYNLAVLPPTQTFGDALTRIVDTQFQAVTSTTIANTTTLSTMTAMAGLTGVGSTTFPAGWVAAGRSVRFTARGKYGTTGTPNWTFALFLGTTTVLTTGAVASPASQTNQTWSESCLATIVTTGGAGTVDASCDIFVSSNGINTAVIGFSTTTAAAVTVDLTSQLTVNPVFTWGTANASNTLTINNETVEFLN